MTTWTHGGGAQSGKSITGGVTYPVSFSDGANLDAFGRLRVSEVANLFDVQLQYDKHPLFWEDQTVGGGAAVHDPNNSGVNLQVGTADGDSVIRQTRSYYRYQPGKSQYIVLTGILGDGKGNVTQRIGYYDADNGLFFDCVDGEAGLNLRSKSSGSVVNTRVAQTSWNLDTMDGSSNVNNPSGINYSPSFAQVFVIDLEWLSVGRVRMGFFMEGILRYVHEFLNSNRSGGAYMTTANLPARYEIVNTGVTASATTLKQLCTSIMSEGGFQEELGLPYADANGVTEISVTTRVPILSMRPKATFNSIVNRGTIIAESFSVFAGTNAAFIELVYNGTLTDDTFAKEQSNSIAEVDVAATAISGGEIIFADIVPAGGGGSPATRQGVKGEDLLSNLPLTLDIDGANPIPLSIVATAMTGTAECSGVLNWREIR